MSSPPYINLPATFILDLLKIVNKNEKDDPNVANLGNQIIEVTKMFHNCMTVNPNNKYLIHNLLGYLTEHAVGNQEIIHGLYQFIGLFSQVCSMHNATLDIYQNNNQWVYHKAIENYVAPTNDIAENDIAEDPAIVDFQEKPKIEEKPTVEEKPIVEEKTKAEHEAHVLKLIKECCKLNNSNYESMQKERERSIGEVVRDLLAGKMFNAPCFNIKSCKMHKEHKCSFSHHDEYDTLYKTIKEIYNTCIDNKLFDIDKKTYISKYIQYYKSY